MTKQDTLIASTVAFLAVSLLLFGLVTGKAQSFFAPFGQDGKVTLDFENPRVLYTQAEDYYEDKEYWFARDVANRTLAVDPRFVKAHKLLTAISIKEGDVEKALTSCQEAARLDASDPTIQVTLAGLLRQTGRTAEAESVYNKLLERGDIPPDTREEAQSRLAALPQVSKAQ